MTLFARLLGHFCFPNLTIFFSDNRFVTTLFPPNFLSRSLSACLCFFIYLHRSIIFLINLVYPSIYLYLIFLPSFVYQAHGFELMLQMLNLVICNCTAVRGHLGQIEKFPVECAPRRYWPCYAKYLSVCLSPSISSAMRFVGISTHAKRNRLTDLNMHKRCEIFLSLPSKG